jgi:hypothetical protein
MDLAASHAGGVAGAFLALGGGVALLWSAFSLVVSHHVYDRSELASGSWVKALLPKRVDTWAAIDAGLDGEVALDDVMKGRCIARLDVFDAVMVRAPSIRRARASTPRQHRATACTVRQLALDDASCDVIAVVFTAHEIRDSAERQRFFSEVWRALRCGGRLLLVEHLRDLPNFAAFGPGFLHFSSRSEWLLQAQRAKLRVAAETRVTPWVMALALEKAKPLP